MRRLICSLVTLLLLATALIVAPPADAASADDDARRIATRQIIRAFENYAAANGTYTIPDTGSNGHGNGWFSRSNDGNYTTSVADALAAATNLDPNNIPEDPNLADHRNNGFLVYPCGNRIGIFSETDGITPSTDDTNWWNDNNCKRYPLDTRDHHYFRLSDTPNELTPPEWVYGSELQLESLSLYDFSISWGALYEHALLELTITRVSPSGGPPETDLQFFDSRTASSWTISDFKGFAQEPGDMFALTLVPTNSAGRGEPLKLSVGIPTPIVGETTEMYQTASASRASTNTTTSDSNCLTLTTTAKAGVLLPDARDLAAGSIFEPRYPKVELWFVDHQFRTVACYSDGLLDTNASVSPICDEHGATDILTTSVLDGPHYNGPGGSRGLNFSRCSAVVQVTVTANMEASVPLLAKAGLSVGTTLDWDVDSHIEHQVTEINGRASIKRTHTVTI